MVDGLEHLGTTLSDLADLAELAAAENDAEALDDIDEELSDLESRLAELEFRRMFQGEQDDSNAFLDIQAGSGGTEAQDWAEMLLRMYLRWGEDNAVLRTELGRGVRREMWRVVKSAAVHVQAAIMRSAGCAPKPGSTGSCASRLSIRRQSAPYFLRGGIRFTPKSRTT